MNWYEFLSYAVLSVVMLIAGTRIERRRHRLEDERHAQDRAEDRSRAEELERRAAVERVVEEFGELAFGRPRRAAQLLAFVWAGARQLDDRSVREAVEAIVLRWGPQALPLGRLQDRIIALTDLPEYLRRIDGRASNSEQVLLEMEKGRDG